MFQTMVAPLLAQANRIARHDDDLAQDILSMAYTTYSNALKRGKDLSIGELVNLMKYRAGDLRSGKRLYFGNVSNKTTQDVYNPCNYYNGDVVLLSLDFTMHEGEYEERSFDGQGKLTITTATRDLSDSVLFEIGFARFLRQITHVDRQILRLRLKGYNYSEITRLVDLKGGTARGRLRKIGRFFIKYFELPRWYLARYGLA